MKYKCLFALGFGFFVFCFVLFCFFSVTQISVNVNAFSVQSRLGNDFDHC